MAGLMFRKNDFTVSDKKTNYNEVNFSKEDKNYSIVKVEKDVSDPEYNEKRSYVIKQ